MPAGDSEQFAGWPETAKKQLQPHTTYRKGHHPSQSGSTAYGKGLFPSQSGSTAYGKGLFPSQSGSATYGPATLFARLGGLPGLQGLHGAGTGLAPRMIRVCV